MAKTSPTQRTLQAIRNQKLMAHITEHWNAFARIRQDLFGFVDIVYLDTDRSCLVGVQCTSRSNHNARKNKILLECRKQAKKWLRCKCRIEVWSWGKLKAGWTCKVEEITLEDF